MRKGLKFSPDSLPDQFGGTVAGTTLILDGDSACYVIAATVKTIPTAIRHFQMEVLKLMFLTKTEDARVHLTASDSLKAGRGSIIAAKLYQGNRTGKAKPALLEAVRQAVSDPANCLPEYTVELHRNLEADDACIIDAYRLRDKGILCSADKDLRLTPYPWYSKSTGQVMTGAGFGYLELEYTPAGSPKMGGVGRKFFWAQMLMGDAADNVRGLKEYRGKPIGVVTAYDLLSSNSMSESETANTVLDLYGQIDQNPLPEGWLMWLLRTPDDNFWKYVTSLELRPEIRDYLQYCLHQKWFQTHEETPDE